jgi:hypothetical protein
LRSDVLSRTRAERPNFGRKRGKSSWPPIYGSILSFAEAAS